MSAIRTVGVVGTGVIGASWTGLFLANGLRVVVSDPASGSEKKLNKYLENIWPDMKKIGLKSGASLDNYQFVGTNACVTNSLGPRWALTGPLLANAMGGGGGTDGFRHLLEHLGPATEVWLKDMQENAFEFNKESLDALSTSVGEELKGKDVQFLEAERDRLLVEILKLKNA
ncbi:unnamed protein product [Aureobasidium pullulans]|nr:unnamed protein product [Aureobasidium pullulans]